MVGLRREGVLQKTVRLQSVAWFATAVVAGMLATLVLTWAWSADAAPGESDATFVPITPCRLIDTRPPPDRVGTAAMFGTDDTKTFAVHGVTGDCTIPSDAVGLSLNVTTLNATLPTFLTVWDEGAIPNSSSLNPSPGQPPIPNAVSTPLTSDGSLRVYNLQGSVDVIVDVNGYFTKDSLQEIARRLDALEAQRPVVWTEVDSFTSVGATDTVAVEVSLTVPAAGNITVFSTTTARETTADQFVACSIDESATFDAQFIQRWQSPGAVGKDSQLAGVRVFDVAGGQSVTYSLVCLNTSGGTSEVFDATIAAMFTPAP